MPQKNTEIVWPIANTDSSRWKLRDMASRMLFHRYGTDGAIPNTEQLMPMSSEFESASSLAHIRRDKAGIVRSAFDAAATAVLEAVDKALELENAKGTSESDPSTSDLPPFISKWIELDDLREKSMDRSHDNKEFAKKKSVNSEGATASSTGLRKAQSGNETASASKSASAREAPKFTRNTPASSAAALDSRSTSSRAILCSAGNVAFEALTPSFSGVDIDVVDVPQNPAKATTNESEGLAPTINMGAVMVEAQTLGQRVITTTESAVRRAKQRYQFRRDNVSNAESRKSFYSPRNPFAWRDENEENVGSGVEDFVDESSIIKYDPNDEAVTTAWRNTCIPRLMEILETGAGHALYHDIQWNSRHGRVADILHELSRVHNIWGTHLLVTTEPEVASFAKEFHHVNSHLRLLDIAQTESLRALVYHGERDELRKLRQFFPKSHGLKESPYHVIITTHTTLLQDYLHFCQIPLEVVLLDDGVSWMAAAQSDPNSPLGTLWDTAIWSTKDQQIGLAGTGFKNWDFSLDDPPPSAQKEAWIGLTVRHRIMTSSTMKVRQRSSTDLVPVSGLVNFVMPHFADVVREEWDRSRIHTDSTSMEHFRKLLSRSLVVHHPDGSEDDMHVLAMSALNGSLPPSERVENPEVPELISDEIFVNDGKVAYSRRSSLAWLGPPESSWLRYELGIARFQPILDIMSRSTTYGHFCEEITTASSTTSSGATGQVAGTMAYRLAIRCCRHFGSEQGLRQHLSALHAPPGTWLCRTCGIDCITSQARTHHERSCGHPTAGAAQSDNTLAGSNANLQGGGRHHHGPSGVVGKKKGPRSGAQAQGGTSPEDKDPDGSFRVPGFRGVWVNPAGKHFVKVDGKRIKSDDGELLCFDNTDDAAREYDNAVKRDSSADDEVELNFKPDGTRVVYEDVTLSTTTGLGGSASNVVPALSVINIKDLPSDVKPLLRDPRQTSRTGGNSKRHVYAYRGVCRQARKGHDRWQSQISFMGVNHYLGTFDSEWDAAAIYAWAHLILYGEEATKKAQKEGEEAAAAYEQEKKDIAEGKIVPAAKPDKKKKRVVKKKDEVDSNTVKDKDSASDSKKRKSTDDPNEKKPKVASKSGLKADKEAIAPILSKGVLKTTVLAPRENFLKLDDSELKKMVVERLRLGHEDRYCVSDGGITPVDRMLRPCFPIIDESSALCVGGAMLVGLSSMLFGWDVEVFVASRCFDSSEQERVGTSALSSEFGEDGVNCRFRSLIQGPLCVLGSTNQSTINAHKSLGFGELPIGGAVGEIDCHIGGIPFSCTETAASIRYAPTTASDFQFAAICDDDIVTLNGKRITSGMGCFPLFNEDICTVGSRVFAFLLPFDT